MSTERDTGLEALQRGDTVSAISLLEQACQIEPNDFQSHLYLGAAYGQSNRHEEAVQSITRAVQLEPGNASARFNLGIALEHAGWPNEAVTVFQQAIMLQPDYLKASEALARLQAASPQTTIIQNTAPQQTSQIAPQQGGLGSYQSGGESSQPDYGASASYGSQQPLPGTHHPADGGVPPSPGMPGSSVYGASPYVASPYPVANSNFQMRPVYEDTFSLAQAAKDWIALLKSPTQFFENQVDREGLKAPMAMIVFYCLVTLPSVLIGSLMAGQSILPVLVKQLFSPLIMIIVFLVPALLIHAVGKMFGNSAAYSGSFRALVYSCAPLYLITIIYALILPSALAPLTKASQPAGSTVSNSTFKSERLVLIQSTNDGTDTQTPPPSVRRGRTNSPSSIDGQQNNPGMPGSPRIPGVPQNPFGNSSIGTNPMPSLTGGLLIIVLLVIIALIWSFILQVMGISSIQRISTGAAVGTIIISNIISFVIVFGLMMILGAAMFAALAGSGGIH